MNWNRVEGEWKQLRGKVLYRWGSITNDQFASMTGRYEEIVGKLQARYGDGQDDANRELKEFRNGIQQLKRSLKELMQIQKPGHSGSTVDGSRGGEEYPSGTSSRVATSD